MARDYESFKPEEKAEIIQAVFGAKIPTYQWFEVAPGADLDLATIANETCTPMEFGNIELHGSRCPTGLGLRVRNSKKLNTEVQQKGADPAKLYQAVDDYMNPFDGWVDFLEGKIISGIPEHESIARAYHMDFELTNPKIESGKMVDLYRKCLAKSGKSENEINLEAESYKSAIAESTQNAMDCYNQRLLLWRKKDAKEAEEMRKSGD